MATNYNPRIITDNLVFLVDAGNVKSYAGDVISETAGPAYGYYGGGQSPGSTNRSEVDRIDYSSDTSTAATKGPLSDARGYTAATGNISYGYWAGGYPTKSIVDRIDYSNDTATAAAKGPLSQTRGYLGATGTNSYGYFGGGFDPGPRTTVDRIDYSNDTPTTPAKGPLSAARYSVSATGNTSYGYFAGGGPGPFSTIDRIDYSNDTATAAAKGPLSVARFAVAATGNASYGYFGGGHLTISTVDRVDYSSDTPTASTKGPLSLARYCLGAASSRANALPDATTYAYRSVSTPQGTSYGYFAGGYYPGIVSTIQRIDFDNDTATSSSKGTLDNSRYGAGATGNASYGYFGGGRTSTQHTWVDRIDYASDTSRAVTKGPLSAARYRIGATGSADYGYFMGGIFPSPTAYFSAVDRLDYSSDSTAAAVKGPLTIARYYTYGTGTQSYGYYFGGQADAPTKTVTTVDRIDYSNDTPTTTAKGPLTQKRFAFGATGNASYAWCGGGRKYDTEGANFSTVDRLDYSSDTSTTSPKGPLAAVRYGVSATGNQSYGYFAGGAPSMSSLTTIDRIDYSNDTPTATAKGYLDSGPNDAHTATSPRAYALPTSSTSYPWYDASGKGNTAENSSGGATYSTEGGGSFTFNGTSNYVSDDDKSDLKLGTGDFTLAAWIRPGASPVGTDYGYYMGGDNPITLSVVDRVDYSNDTPTASARGPLTADRRDPAATGNQNYAYNAGGDDHPTKRSNIDRVDYSNDSPTATAKGPLSAARHYHAATGTADYGYYGGGDSGSPSILSSVDRVDYSNDTATAAAKGPLSVARKRLSATGNTSYGYFGGGEPGPSDMSTVDRIDYSNDTATASPKGPLDTARNALAATGNASYGYFGGGSPGPYSTVSRIDYSNDTATAAAKGPLSVARYRFAATGNTSYGWFGGGAFPAISTVDRIDFSNDTATAAAKGPLSVARWAISAASSRANALPTTAQSDNNGIISYSDSGGNEDATTCQLDVNANGKIMFSGSGEIVTSTSSPTVDTWVHAAVTRSGSAVSLYINGILEDTGTSSQDFSDYAKVTIGANRPRTTFYAGDISQVQIYKGKALSSDEVQQNLNVNKSRFGL